MGDEQHRHLLARADPSDQRRHRGLAGEVEAVERLVEDEQLRLAHERLGDQQPLLLTARELPDRARGVTGGIDELDHVLHTLALAAASAGGRLE